MSNKYREVLIGSDYETRITSGSSGDILMEFNNKEITVNRNLVLKNAKIITKNNICAECDKGKDHTHNCMGCQNNKPVQNMKIWINDENLQSLISCSEKILVKHI